MKNIILITLTLLSINIFAQNVNPETFGAISNKATAQGKYVYTATGGTEGKIAVDSIGAWFGGAGSNIWEVDGKLITPIDSSNGFLVKTPTSSLKADSVLFDAGGLLIPIPFVGIAENGIVDSAGIGVIGIVDQRPLGSPDSVVINIGFASSYDEGTNIFLLNSGVAGITARNQISIGSKNQVDISSDNKINIQTNGGVNIDAVGNISLTTKLIQLSAQNNIDARATNNGLVLRTYDNANLPIGVLQGTILNCSDCGSGGTFRVVVYDGTTWQNIW